MANPVPAFEGTECDKCGDILDEGDLLFMTPDGRLCSECAESEEYVCACGKFKKAEYGTCYTCHKKTE